MALVSRVASPTFWDTCQNDIGFLYLFVACNREAHHSSHPFLYCEYLSPHPLFTAGRSAILSIHFIKCGNASNSFFSKPLNSHALIQGHVPISATLYLPLPLPARYSRGEPVYLPESWISSTPKTRRVSLRKRSIASGKGC